VRTAAVHGVAPAMVARAAMHGRELGVAISLVRSGADSYLLARLTVPDGLDTTRSARRGSNLLERLDCLSEGFLVTDLGLRIFYANRAFTDLTGEASPADLRGESIARWVDLSQSDVAALTAQMSMRQAVQEFKTTLRRKALALRHVVLCAVAVPDGHDACWGFCVRAALPHVVPG